MIKCELLHAITEAVVMEAISEEQFNGLISLAITESLSIDEDDLSDDNLKKWAIEHFPEDVAIQKRFIQKMKEIRDNFIKKSKVVAN